MSNLRSARLVGIGAIAGIALSLGLSALAERGNTGRNVLPLDELRQFSEVFGTIKAYYVEPVKDNKLITDAISGMLTGLDPHSAYLDENAFKELQVNTQGEFGGLGIEIGTEDGFIKVVSPIEGTPASKAGVKAGDLIIKIGDTPTKDMRLEEAVKMMRGKPKSPITLTLQRKGVPEPIVLTIVRDIIQVQSVRSKLLEPGVGYIRISQFQEHTVNNLVNHLEQLAKQNNGPLKSVVLDLRNDPGGLLHGAIGVSAAFLQPGMEVTSTDGRTDDAKRSFYASPQDYMTGSGKTDRISSLPAWTKTAKMVVLVNAGSASASEIVAGAQACRRAGHADLRQGLRADHPAAGRPEDGHQAHHSPLLHAQRPLHPGPGHRTRLRGGRIGRWRHQRLPHPRGRSAAPPEQRPRHHAGSEVLGAFLGRPGTAEELQAHRTGRAGQRLPAATGAELPERQDHPEGTAGAGRG